MTQLGKQVFNFDATGKLRILIVTQLGNPRGLTYWTEWTIEAGAKPESVCTAIATLMVPLRAESIAVTLGAVELDCLFVLVLFVLVLFVHHTL